MDRWHGLNDRMIWFRQRRMNFREYTLPPHLREQEGLPRSHQERLLWIKRRVEAGFYDKAQVLQAVADAFLDPPEKRRAGEQATPDPHQATGSE